MEQAGVMVLAEGGRMRIRGVVMVAVLALSACSGGGSSDGLNLGTTESASSSSAVEVSTTVAAVVAVSTSVVAETTLPATTAVETTVPVTTVPEPASQEDQVKADFESARQARAQCTFDPFSCDYAAVAIVGSPMDVQTHEVVAKRIKDNLRGKPGFGGVEITVESVGFEGAAAFVTICAYDTQVLFDISDPNNPGDDIIYNDSEDSYRVRWEMRVGDDRWLLYEGDTIQRLRDGDLCES